RIHVSRKGDFGAVRLQASDYGRDAFGQVVVARDFGEALESRLSESRHLVRYRPARFVALEEAAGPLRSLRIRDEQGERVLGARLLVAADGTRSDMRQALGIGAIEHDYRQTLFVARMRAEQAPDGTAYERFGEHGPTALLPRGDRHFGVVHGVQREQAEAVAALDDDAWIQRVQGEFGWRVGRLLVSGPRSAYPIVRVVAERTFGERAVLLGNAAQTLHPIGAQGFNLGLRDALTLAELVGQADDPGAAAVLEAHARRRHEDRQRTLEFSDTLARLTGNASPLLRPLRSLGLLAADNSASLQSMLVGGAMGFRGDVPALCREVAR
ncbi:MAG: 2-octaprenyl-6-methoxyphenyl hydroxylase, partial [Lysobacteraceae bacterium]